MREGGIADAGDLLTANGPIRPALIMEKILDCVVGINEDGSKCVQVGPEYNREFKYRFGSSTVFLGIDKGGWIGLRSCRNGNDNGEGGEPLSQVIC